MLGTGRPCREQRGRLESCALQKLAKDFSALAGSDHRTSLAERTAPCSFLFATFSALAADLVHLARRLRPVQ